MERKGDCLYAIKKALTQHSKEIQLSNNQEPKRKNNKKAKKKKSIGIKLKNGEINSFLPIFRQPSSIEKILCEAERDHNFIFRPQAPMDQAKESSTSVPSPLLRLDSPKVPSYRYVSSPKPISPRVSSPRAPSPEARREFVSRPEPTLLVQNVYATKIQATFRGHKARRSFRALKGLVRLQGVVRGHGVKCQTMNAMKYMQLLVNAQTQVQPFYMSEDRADCLLIKKEKEARLHKKIDAMIKRERSMTYSHSHQALQWWNWMDMQKKQSQVSTRPSQSSQPQSSNQIHLRLNEILDISTPNSSKSTFVSPSKPIHTPQPYNSSNIAVSRYSRGRAKQESPLKDDDNSITSCSTFSVPSYMAPTVSAKAKLRANSHPKERLDRTTVSSIVKRRT